MADSRPADIDAAIVLIAQARAHLDGRSVGTLGPAIVRDLVAALSSLAFSIDRHHPKMRKGARRALLEQMASARRARAQLDALVEEMNRRERDHG